MLFNILSGTKKILMYLGIWEGKTCTQIKANEEERMKSILFAIMGSRDSNTRDTVTQTHSYGMGVMVKMHRTLSS